MASKNKELLKVYKQGESVTGSDDIVRELLKKDIVFIEEIYNEYQYNGEEIKVKILGKPSRVFIPLKYLNKNIVEKLKGLNKAWKRFAP